MAINFLDGITVNSGTSSTPTIVAAGARPITLTGGGIGSVAIGGSNGGWATGYFFTGYSGTNRGGFGALGSVDALSYFWIGDAYNDTTMVIQPNAGNVGIGTTAPAAKLDVIQEARVSFASGNQYRTRITNTDGNTRILSDGDTSSIIFGVAGSGTNATAVERMRISSSGNVGIGTTSPVAKLHVSSGVLRVEGTGCGIQMPDTSGNPTLKIVTDQNNFTGCNIINGWGNNLNTGVGIGTTRSDGIAMQVRTGVGLSSGFATNSGTSRFQVNGNGNVGVGTTAPAEKLDVSGNIRVTGVGNALSFDTLSVAGSNGIKTINNFETVVYNGRGSAGFAVIGNANIRLGFGAAATTSNADLLINSSGNVGIGTTGPTQKLDVSGNINATGAMECTKFIANAGNSFEFDVEGNAGFNMRHTAANQSMFFLTAAGTGEIKFGTNNVNSRVVITNTGALKSSVSLAVGSITPSTTTGRIDASNDVVAFSTSDIRLKDNIKSIDKALDKVNSIQGIEFDWIEKEEVHGNSGHDIGVIAQEIENILPDVVTTRDNGYKAVKYEKIVPLLIEAIKDLSKQVDGLKRLI